MNETLYKWTRATGNATHGSGTWRKGRWRSVRGPLVPCLNGIHLCRERDLPYWISEALWRVEVEPGVERIDVNDGNSKLVVRRARIVERLAGWNETTARLFTADCAERALPIFERARPSDDRPRKVIEAARAFARGQIGRLELRAAAVAADVAAYDATYAAADAAASYAAHAAATVATYDAATYAAADDAAAYTAAYAAHAAAAAADAAHTFAAAVRARKAERNWQSARILAYATGELS